MSGRRATRNLSGEIRSGRGTFGSSMRTVRFEAGLSARENLRGLGGGWRYGDGVHALSLDLARRSYWRTWGVPIALLKEGFLELRYHCCLRVLAMLRRHVERALSGDS